MGVFLKHMSCCARKSRDEAPLSAMIMRGGISLFKSTPGTDKFMTTLTRMSMKFHSKLIAFCGSRSRALLHPVRAVNGSTPRREV